MSQLQDSLATTQLPAAMAVTWSNGLGCRFSLIPTDAALACSWVISEVIQPTPVAYGRLKLRPEPWLIPGPHLAGSVQVVTPFGTTFQPWLVSSFFALAGLYGYGLPALRCGDRNEVTGLLATGPTVGTP